MWAKAEDNAEALREAFEEASARAAEEAELATAEALAHADREHQGDLFRGRFMRVRGGVFTESDGAGWDRFASHPAKGRACSCSSGRGFPVCIPQ